MHLTFPGTEEGLHGSRGEVIHPTRATAFSDAWFILLHQNREQKQPTRVQRHEAAG